MAAELHTIITTTTSATTTTPSSSSSSSSSRDNDNTAPPLTLTMRMLMHGKVDCNQYNVVNN